MDAPLPTGPLGIVQEYRNAPADAADLLNALDRDNDDAEQDYLELMWAAEAAAEREAEMRNERWFEDGCGRPYDPRGDDGPYSLSNYDWN